MLNELSHIEKDKYCKISFICESKKIIQMSVYVKQKQTHRHSLWLQTCGYQREAGSGEGQIRGMGLTGKNYYIQNR